ncbi:NYN domain-containing protein [Longispora sp. K20-0274]|uniref:NYN domain-containing protein n=1 Tax=Longispora sp. K20-0274 TaxID=3088255 RepID=UPI00399B903C
MTGEEYTPDIPDVEPQLPEPVRQRVIALVAGALSGLPFDEVPAALKKIARFAPNRRARLGGPLLAAHVAADPLFRQRIGKKVLEEAGELGEALLEGACPAAADPVEVAALAYLTRPEGWVDMVEATAEAVRAEADSAAVEERIHAAEARASRAEHERNTTRVELDRARDELAKLRAEAAQLREETRGLARAASEAERREKKATELLGTEKGRWNKAAADHDAELRRMRAKVTDLEGALETARHTGRDARALGDARTWLLLETISQAAQGLRRELSLEPTTRLPADFVAEASADLPDKLASSARALEANDPARLDQLLSLPRVHLVVDGYNVTKTGFGELSLEQQRTRLVTGLGGIAAQTGAEVTCVFDGAERMHGLPPTPRGVRVLFSRKGETADELIRRLVRAEPSGRPVVVISTDREVADGVRRHGAYPLSSETLLRRLNRK